MIEKLKDIYETKVPSFLKNKWGLLAVVLGVAFVFWLVAKSLFLLKLAFWAGIGYVLFKAVQYVKESFDKHTKE